MSTSGLAFVMSGQLVSTDHCPVGIPPSIVDKHVGKFRCRGEIDVMLDGSGIHAGLESNAGGSTAAPRVPSRLASLDPRGVGDLRRGLRSRTMLDSMRRPGSSAIMKTRQGL